MIVIAVLYAYSRPPAPAPPPPPGGFAFAALGDAPYYPWEELRYRRVVRQLDDSELAFVIHVGDILWRPCSEEKYRERLATFEGLRHPLVYTPGDNEWADCHGEQEGSYRPLDRLELLREVFFAEAALSLGGRRMEVASQGAAADTSEGASVNSEEGTDEGTDEAAVEDAPEGAEHPELVENLRWEHDGVIFATVHLVGSRNALDGFAGRGPEDDEESRVRTAGDTAWMREAFAVARARDARALVLAFHADLALDEPLDDPYRAAYEPFVEALEEEAAAFRRPVLLIHGDDHEHVVDHPLVRRSTGELLEHVTRLEVPGSPDVGWVRVTVAPPGAGGDEGPFSFEGYVVPFWRLW